MGGPRRAILAVSGALLLLAAMGYGLARRAERQRVADFGACLIGEPLAPKENASDRMFRLDLSRPSGSSWPARCAPLARAAAGSWTRPKYERAALLELAPILEREKPATPEERDLANVIFVDVPLPPSRAWRPSWHPATFLAHPAGTPFPCNDVRPLLGTDQDDTRIHLRGSDCSLAVVSERERLDAVHVLTPADPVPGSPKAPPAVNQLDHVHSLSCRTSATNILVLERYRKSPDVVDVGVVFYEDHASAFSAPPASVVVTSGLGARDASSNVSPDASAPTVSCRGNETRIAWAWTARNSTEIVTVTCVPGRCDVRTKVVPLEITRHGAELLPPTVVDLFGSTALVWVDRHSVRTRIGALDDLANGVDQVLWHDDTATKFSPPIIVTRNDVAIASVDLGGAIRLFRLAASGPRELTLPK